MEGVLIAVISGLFGLAGIWLSHYLQEKKEEKGKTHLKALLQPSKRTKTAIAMEATTIPASPPNEKSSDEQTEEIVFVRTPSWWLLSVSVIAACIGAAFFSGWVLEYALGVFKITLPEVPFSWLALAISGFVWGIVYVFVGTLDAEEVSDCLFAMFAPYDDLFDPVDTADFVRAVLTALPINLIIAWGLAVTLGNLAAVHFGADFSGVVYLAFGATVGFGILWFLSEEL